MKNTLEDHIMNCWNVVEDIKSVYYYHDIDCPSEDDMQNCLLGLFTLYQMKFEQLFDCYSKMIAEKRIK